MTIPLLELALGSVLPLIPKINILSISSQNDQLKT
jgi:hypothetical protein